MPVEEEEEREVPMEEQPFPESLEEEEQEVPLLLLPELGGEGGGDNEIDISPLSVHGVQRGSTPVSLVSAWGRSVLRGRELGSTQSLPDFK